MFDDEDDDTHSFPLPKNGSYPTKQSAATDPDVEGDDCDEGVISSNSEFWRLRVGAQTSWLAGFSQTTEMTSPHTASL